MKRDAKPDIVDTFFNPNLFNAAPKPKPGKVSTAIAFVVVAIILLAALAIWLGFLAILITAVFGLSILKSLAAATLFNMVLVSLNPPKGAK